jgi:hypothetical protein
MFDACVTGAGTAGAAFADATETTARPRTPNRVKPAMRM